MIATNIDQPENTDPLNNIDAGYIPAKPEQKVTEPVWRQINNYEMNEI